MDALVWLLLAALVIGAAAMFFWQQRNTPVARPPKQRVVEARDTVADWPPTATRVLSNGERQALALLAEAVPELLVLAQVPLSRFLRVPTRHSYGEWLGRVGQLSADLVVCGPDSQVLAVVEVRPAGESPRSLQRHQRMVRVLKAADIPVLVWTEGEFPTQQAVRQALLPQEAAAAGKAALPAAAAPAPIPARPAAATVADDDEDPPREPPPTTWYSDLDPPTGGPTPPRS